MLETHPSSRYSAGQSLPMLPCLSMPPAIFEMRPSTFPGYSQSGILSTSTPCLTALKSMDPCRYVSLPFTSLAVGGVDGCKHTILKSQKFAVKLPLPAGLPPEPSWGPVRLLQQLHRQLWSPRRPYTAVRKYYFLLRPHYPCTFPKVMLSL